MNTDTQCKVIKINTGRVEFTGTEKECRKFVRTHYDYFHQIYRADGSIARK